MVEFEIMRHAGSRPFYQITKGVVIICLIMTVFQGVDVRDFRSCSVNSIFNESIKKCIECPDGTYGPKCTLSCPPLKFGRFCSKTCSCSKEQCNAVRGCSEETSNNYHVEKRNNTTELMYTGLSTSTGYTKNIPSPVAKKTLEKQNWTSFLITVTGSSISSLLLVAIGFQLRSRIILCRRERNHEQGMLSEIGSGYVEARDIDN